MSYIPFPPLSPEIFTLEVGGLSFVLRWYALAYIAGILIGWRLVLRAVGQPQLWAQQPPMTAAHVERLVTWIILGVIIGGRLGFVIFYQPGYYISNPLEILQVWKGGMSFHGGFLGVVIATAIFCYRERISVLGTADLLALATPPALFLGRLANFVNAELWGRATDMPWGVAFPGREAQNCGQALGEICARHPSQLYEAMLEGALLCALILWGVWRKGWLRHPGRVTGVFFAGYGLARFLVEFVRQPDAQFVSLGNASGLAFHINGYGLTMGQTLSLPMLIIGVFLIMRRA